MAWNFGKKKDGNANREEMRAKAITADKAGDFIEAFKYWLALAEAGDPEALFTTGERLERGLGTIQNFPDALKFFRNAAELQWSAAYGKLGDIYLNGRAFAADAPPAEDGSAASEETSGLFATLATRKLGVRPDHAEAAQWNHLAAEQGDPKAQVRLAYQYASTLGVPQDYKAAEYWFRQAAGQGDAGGQLGLGMILAAGHGRTKDLTQATQWLAKAAAQDNATAKTCLAVLLMQAENSARDPELALVLLREAAEARFPEAMFLYGEYKRIGVACEKDESEAETWLRRAALTGHVKGIVAAGALLRDRSEPDYMTAAAFFREAADLGDGSAQFALGELYARGQGVHQDGRLAASWFEKAAANGVLTAYQRVGALYADGLGLEQDFDLAAEWFGKAQRAGLKTVSYELATLHHYGRGVPVDAKKALHLYKKASDEGDARASLRLGILFAQGELIAQNWTQAAKFYGIAASQGSADADLNLAFLMIRKLGVGNPEVGIKILEDNAATGNPKAIWSLYRLHSEGTYVPVNTTEADKWLMRAVERGAQGAAVELARRLRDEKPTPITAGKILALLEVAAQSGEVAAQSLFGLICYEGKLREQDMSGAVVWLTRAANRGDVFSQAWLGDVLASGKGVPKHPEAAKAWYRLAARQGDVGSLLALTAAAEAVGENPDEDQALFEQWLALAERGAALAQRMVGDYLVRGVRCKKDLKSGASWLRKASAQGNIAAKVILSALLVNGEIDAEWPNEAADLMHQAAAQGDAGASYNLGVCYRLGLVGLAKDREASLLWHRRAANQNHAAAQLALGDLLLERSDVPDAATEARGWYTAAARAGLARASLNLGRMHETGVGAPRNPSLALDFYRQAADGGIEEAKAGIKRCTAAS